MQISANSQPPIHTGRIQVGNERRAALRNNRNSLVENLNQLQTAKLDKLPNAYTHVCEGGILCDKPHCVGRSDADKVVANVLSWLNAGYIELDENGNLSIVNLVNDEIELYLSRVTVQAVTRHEGSCLECCTDFGYVSIEPFGPSGSCSNIFGHSWGAWEMWRSAGAINHHWNLCGIATMCGSPMERRRWCQRTFCTQYYLDLTTIFVHC